MNPTDVTSGPEGTNELRVIKQSLVGQHKYRFIFKFLEIRSCVW